MDKRVFLGNSFSHPYTHHPRIPLFEKHRPSACPLYPTYLITFGRDGMLVPSCMNLSTLWSRDWIWPAGIRIHITHSVWLFAEKCFGFN